MFLTVEYCYSNSYCIITFSSHILQASRFEEDDGTEPFPFQEFVKFGARIGQQLLQAQNMPSLARSNPGVVSYILKQIESLLA